MSEENKNVEMQSSFRRKKDQEHRLAKEGSEIF
jgi:hypothetical protein